ncbi:MAG: MotA/TolQ/ExbB proton channel family protein [Synechococcales cyanobacterium RU_4_20]|nr:MotA/TolQ/ExbB proton channel family protein [Synechococcales cyanobacterium RU_4_20]NJR67624.1 MotA/TolQ/ExbB proton channel family protein [Synechococcales cyanobacterium CRU_2_2]
MRHLWDLLLASGWTAAPLLLFSVVAIACAVERGLFWSRLSKRQPQVMRSALSALDSSPELAMEQLRRNINLPVARLFLEAMALEDASPEEFALAVEAGVQAELPGLKRFTNVFDVIVSLSPLLGLLGTVLGLIRSFASLNLGDIGGSNSLGVTGGISEALLSTAFGLIVAIGTLFISSIFRGFYVRELATIQEYAAKFELLHRRRAKPEVYATYS